VFPSESSILKFRMEISFRDCPISQFPLAIMTRVAHSSTKPAVDYDVTRCRLQHFRKQFDTSKVGHSAIRTPWRRGSSCHSKRKGNPGSVSFCDITKEYIGEIDLALRTKTYGREGYSHRPKFFCEVQGKRSRRLRRITGRWNKTPPLREKDSAAVRSP